MSFKGNSFLNKDFKKGNLGCLNKTKTAIRYAKENDRERKKGRRRDIEREGEIREREVKGIERVKGALQ